MQVWLTTVDLTSKLSPQPGLPITANSPPGDVPTIDVDPDTTLQVMDGFGVALTDSSVSLMYSSMSDDQRATLLRNLFNPTDGIGLSVVRVPMGASDFTASDFYSYDDLPAGQTDPTLDRFSIAHDLDRIVPTLQHAMALNPSIKLIANPWSPPGWMKSNTSLLGSSNGTQGSRLLAANFPSLAQYFVKFIQAYESRGLPVYAITPQNEPLYAPASYPGMLMSVYEQMSFINDNLSPALAQANLHPKILAYDYNWDNPSYPAVLLRDPATANNIAGIAWHCYAGDPSAMGAIHAEFPTRDMYETECSPSSVKISTVDLLLRSVQNWARTVVLWNAALDPTWGPHKGGCDDCAPLVIIAPTGGGVTYPLDYYQIGHFSKFAVPAALHIMTTKTGDGPDNVAFLNPDGTWVLVAHNPGDTDSTFNVRWNGSQSFSYSLPARATATFTWQP